jgi:hypothetical protein
MSPAEIGKLITERRWLRFTPDRLIGGLLVLEGLLLLSEHFRWFAFNQHKGWTVLIVVASVGVAMLLMLLWFAAALLFRCRFQFSIRSLLVLTVAVAIACSWLAVEMRNAKEQNEAVEAIENAGGLIGYDDGVFGDPLGGPEPPGPAWLRSLLGKDFSASLVNVSLAYSRATDAAMTRLKGLSQLQSLDLDGTQVTDAALEHLKGLTQLQSLGLGGTQVTDAGLEHLKGLTQLQSLGLGGTKVTDAGVKKLQQALPNCAIDWEPQTSDESQSPAPPAPPGG